MGTTPGKPFAGLFQEIEPRIVFFGLDGTGKSSILHKLKTGETLSKNMPTVGFEMENFKYKNSSFSFIEIGGQHRYKMIVLWKHYFHRVSGIVYVVDSMDRERIEEAKSFLYMVMDEGHVLENMTVLVYGNKNEVPGAMSASKACQELMCTLWRRYT